MARFVSPSGGDIDTRKSMIRVKHANARNVVTELQRVIGILP
jgi:hypothetical protein